MRLAKMADVGIVGVGNLLLKDEGIGVHVVQALEKLGIEGVKLIDAGTSPDFPFLVQGLRKLLVVDAVQLGGQPGAVYRFPLSELDLEPEAVFSLHDVGLIENLKLAQTLGGPGEVTIIGVEPAEIGWGLELSPVLREKFPRILDLVLEERNALLRTEAV